MYHCYNPRKLLLLLSLDAVVICLWLIGAAIGKSVFSAENTKEGVFLPVIMYHSITENVSGNYQVTPEALEADFQYLQAAGYETVTIEELVAYTQGEGELPEHPVMVTFDDGFYNNLSLALPLLEKYDMCAVVSIVGYYTEVTAVNDPHADAYSYLTWEDVQVLLNSGRIELGSHTYNLHSNTERAGCSILYGESEDDYAAMLEEDLGMLQTQSMKKTGTLPTAFAYPYGFICKESIPVLKDLGFVCTFTCYERPNYITRNPDCLYGLDRYNRSSAYSTEEFFRTVLTP
jgi:peptidoglycan/xylan/chitin deacetylase (PgdA/CDA1 family)